VSIVRQRRLRADHESVTRAFESHPHIRIKDAEGDPPERYRIEYRVKGLAVKNGEVVEKTDHLVEVYLTLSYPRQSPQCRMLTPVFHPNIAPHAICIGDHWSAGESLATLIARIGELITFQSYNTKSPLNGEAARWADEHMDRLPLQRVDLSVDTAKRAAGTATPPHGVRKPTTRSAPRRAWPCRPTGRRAAAAGGPCARRPSARPRR
jgi:ubiquitin-protein ligase